MPSTVIEWYNSRRGVLQRTVLPRALPQKEIEQLQEYFQNTPDGVQRTLRQMGQAAPTQNPAPRPPPPPRNLAEKITWEKITWGPYRGFTLDEVIAMAEMGLLSESSEEDSGSLEEEEEVEEELEEEDEEECLTERETRTLTELLSESYSPLVKLPVCRPQTPERSPHDFAGERSWELRVNQDLTLERRVCTFEELLVRLKKDRSVSQV